VNAAAGDERTRDLEERLLELVGRLGSLTSAQARRYIRNLSAGEAGLTLAQLAEAGLLDATLTQAGTARYTLALTGAE
jgi:hypothetical protein